MENHPHYGGYETLDRVASGGGRGGIPAFWEKTPERPTSVMWRSHNTNGAFARATLALPRALPALTSPRPHAIIFPRAATPLALMRATPGASSKSPSPVRCWPLFAPNAERNVRRAGRTRLIAPDGTMQNKVQVALIAATALAAAGSNASAHARHDHRHVQSGFVAGLGEGLVHMLRSADRRPHAWCGWYARQLVRAILARPITLLVTGRTGAEQLRHMQVQSSSGRTM